MAWLISLHALVLHCVSPLGPVPRGALIAPETLARERLIHDAKKRLPSTLQANQRAPYRNAKNESARPVDRVERPDIICPFAREAKLFTCNAMIRAFARQNAPHDHFRLPVRGRNGIKRGSALMICGRIRAKMPQRNFTCGIGQLMSYIQQHFK
jgi:hypothetical protein